MTPTWILDVVAALMLVVAAVSAARLALARPWRPGSFIIDSDAAHLLMAIAMAGMLAPSLRTFPDPVWEAIFGVLIAVFAFRVARDWQATGVRALTGGHSAPHLAHSASMLYMFLALAPMAGMAGMAGMTGPTISMDMLRHPTAALAFALILIGYSVWDLDRLSGRRYSLTGARASVAGLGAADGPAMFGVRQPATPEAVGRRQHARDPYGPAAGASYHSHDFHGQGGPSRLDGRADGRAVGRAVGRAAGPGHDGDEPHAASGSGAAGAFLLSPAVTVGSRVVMGVAMAFMLLIAI
jgi:hypothetical protein